MTGASTLAARARGATALLCVIWLLALGIAFFMHRGDDAGQLIQLSGKMLGTLAHERVVSATGLVAAAGGLLIACLVVTAWFGLGDLILRLPWKGRRSVDEPHVLSLATRALVGALAWSLVWLGLGTAHLYRGWVAASALLIGLGLAGLAWRQDRRMRSAPPPLTAASYVAIALIVVVLMLAFVAALAPPTARDALFYHFALPKAYLAAGGAVMVPYNMATFYPQAVEMQVVWAMLLGQVASHRIAETAAGITLFAFAPLLALVTYGWARERGVDRDWATIAALMVVGIPTVYDLAGSGYVDLALAAYTALAVRAVGRWWSTLDPAWVAPLTLAVAGALSIKLTAGFLVLALAAMVLVRAVAIRHEAASRERAPRRSTALMGVGGLLLGLLVASPWYIRTWMRTGSPVFPFYLDLWPGEAPGWDATRSRLYQSLLATYGDPHGALDYLLAPIRLAVSAQPDQPAHYDGVLGIAFLFALPLLVWALCRHELDVELRIAALASAALFVFWLFSSQQLRFLLPALPGLAVSMTAAAMSAERGTGRWLRWAFIAAAAASLPVVLAWFAALDPTRAALGGESPAVYLSRRLDYYPYYELINESLPPTARVWLINMRRDSYHLDRPYFSDFVFEDYTLTQYVRDARDAGEVLARARAAGITHLLVRHDVLFDYARSPIVDDAEPREHNLVKLQLLWDFFRKGTRLIRGDRKFWLVDLSPASNALSGETGVSKERINR
ncbi:MAG TPA: hypothetical protein VMS64_10800 [Candidatus Methylomirabilis sp.]|nr:hypothetical protein [Candidatus Methylomirabilis sp.]